MMRFVKDNTVRAECQEGQHRSRLRSLRSRLRSLRRHRWFFHRDTTVGRNDDINGAPTRRRRRRRPLLGRSGTPHHTVVRLRQNHTTFPSRPVKHKHGQIRFYAGIDNRPLDLSDPLRNEGHWHDNEGAAIRSQVRKNKPHHHHRFSEPHFVRNDAAAHHCRSYDRLPAQTKLHTFALILLRFKTGFLDIFIITFNTYLLIRRLRLLPHQNHTTFLVLNFC